MVKEKSKKPIGKKRFRKKYFEFDVSDEAAKILVDHQPDILFRLRQSASDDQEDRQHEQRDRQPQGGQRLQQFANKIQTVQTGSPVDIAVIRFECGIGRHDPRNPCLIG